MKSQINDKIDLVENEVDEKMSLLTEIFSGNRERDKNNLSFEWAINWSLGNNTFLNSYCKTVPTPQGGTHELGLKG